MLKVTRRSRLQFQAKRKTRSKFAVDAMLGSLARKLRAFGFDAAYYREGGDRGLLELARSEGRVILTSDRALAAAAHSSALPALLITGRTDRARLSSLVKSASASAITLVRGDSLCSLCGGGLTRVPRGEAAASLPASVARRHRLFFRCTKCGKMYWRGSHWKKLRRLERAFRTKA